MPIFSTVSASERQANIQADDLYDLITMTATIGTAWSSSSAKIFDDLQVMSEKIQEESGQVPTLLVVDAAVMSFTPQYVTANVMYVGRIEGASAL